MYARRRIMKIGISQEFNKFYKSDEIFSRLKKI